MSRYESIESVMNRVSKEDVLYYYVKQCHNQEDTRKHFNISRPKFYELLKLYDIKKTPEQITMTGVETNKSVHGESYYNNRDKFKSTLIENYGSVQNAYKCSGEKSRKTKFERYGNEYFTNREKAKETLFERTGYYYGHQSKEDIEKAQNTYELATGYTNPSLNPEVKTKISLANKNKSVEDKLKIKEKKLQYWNNLGDTDRQKLHEKRSKLAHEFHSNMSQEDKEHIKKKLREYQVHHWATLSDEERKELMNKRFHTMRENSTLNTSSVEDEVFNKIKLKFPDTIRQYHDERYPYSCDFYIPSKDLFIELNAHWTHGGRPYNEEDSECQQQLREWKEKSDSSKYYANAIYTWTDLDVRKLRCFMNNKLNYKIVYNIADLKMEEM